MSPREVLSRRNAFGEVQAWVSGLAVVATLVATGGLATAVSATAAGAAVAVGSSSPDPMGATARVSGGSGLRALALAAPSADGDPLLTFSEYPVGTQITGQYTDEGVVFTGFTSVPQIATDSANPTSPVLEGGPGYQGDILGSFVVPGTLQPASVDSFSLDVGYIDDPGSTEVRVYGAGEQLLGEIVANSIGIVNVTSNYPGATSFLVHSTFGDSSGWAIDNLSFGAPSAVAGPPVSAVGLATGDVARLDPTCNDGDYPVNCASGDFWHTFNDVSIPGRGPALSLSRTYNSLSAATPGMFGNGWTSSYDVHLVTGADGSLTFVDADGSQVTAGADVNGGYVLPGWADATLTATAGGWTFTRRFTGVSYQFDSTGRLVAESDRNGETTRLGYDVANQLVTATDSAGRVLSFAYGPDGRVSTVTDPAGHVVAYTYDAAGNLSGVTGLDGGVWRYGYDAAHLLTSMTDPDGGTVTNVYDGGGRVTSQTDPMGRVTTFAYDGDAFSAAGGTTTITDPRGEVTLEKYASGELVTLTKGAGTAQAATTSYTYDPTTLGKTSVTDPDGHTATATFDADGNVTESTDALGRVTRSTYNAFDEVVTTTDPLGVTTNDSYDARGNVVAVSKPLTSIGQLRTTHFGHGDAAHPGDVTTVTDPAGNVSTFSYDTDGDVVASTDALDDLTTDTFDGIGERLTEVSPRGNAAGADPAGFTTTYAYDAAGRLTKTVDPLGHVSSSTYDLDGNATSTTDANGNTTRSSYDSDNELSKVTQADGSVLTYGYDGDGNQTSQTDAGDNVTSYGFDVLNRLVSVTDPTRQVTTYSYDPAGNKTTSTDPRGVVTTMSYDAANELMSTSYSDGTPAVTLTYTADGQRASMADGTGTTSYSYDSLGRLVSQTDGAGQRVGYGYNPDGDVTSLTYPNGQTVTRGYDAANRLTSVTDWLGHTTMMSPDADGDTTAVTYGNGVVAAATFDNADQVSAITDTGSAGASLVSFGYTRDSNGQIIATTATGTGQQSQSYSYTALNQLGAVNNTALSYDAAGDIATLPDDASATYNAANQLASLTAGGSTTSYSFDAAGDRTATTGNADATTASGCGICILAATGDATLSATGAAEVTSTGVITDDSNSAAAIRATGSAAIAGTSVFSGGGAKTTGAAKIEPTPSAGTATDPDAGATAPAIAGAPAKLTVSGSKNVTAQPGVYSAISVSGNARLTLAPGDYVLAGADLTVSGSAELTGSGVTLYLTCATYPIPCPTTDAKGSGVKVSGAARLTLNGSADTDGISVLADPNDDATITVAGSGAATVSGDVDIPAAGVSVTGNARFAVTGTLVANTAAVTGSAKLLDTAAVRPTVETSYAYDAAHRLTAVTDASGAVTYSYNGDGLRADTTGADGVMQQFAWNLAGSVATMLSDGSTNYLYDDAGLPIEQIDSAGVVLYYQHDQLGSTVLLTDSTGTVAATYAYGAFGQVVGHTGAADTPLRFAGQYQDATGLYYLRNRYYDPATAQFLTVDPLAALTGQPYGYAGDNPVGNSDPTGLSWYDPSWVNKAASTVANGAATAWNATGGKVVHQVATGTYGVCVSGSIGWGPGGTAEGCIVESHLFRHGGVIGTLGGGGQSPTVGFGVGFLSSNASSPSQLSGPFGYANGNVVVGPDIGLYVGGEGFIGKDSCGSTIVGSVSSVGLGADLPLPFGFGGGVSYTWVGQLW